MEAIEVRNVVKSYRMNVGRARVREMIPPPLDRGVRRLAPRWWTRDTFHALDGVTLSVERGTSVGIVGHNGAGKSTLLKVIAGVTSTDSGGVHVNGRIAALIDALVGFHPDLTGRENIYLLGAMHGFGRREMTPRIQRVLEFAEIDELADTPLKRYSSGMAARLGFAVVTALEVEILMVDEVLAVGDAQFQRKCVGWLDEYRARGGTLLFVSHNLGLIRNMTQRAVWLDHGRVLGDAPTQELLADYARAAERRDSTHSRWSKWQVMRETTAVGQRRWGAGGIRVDEVHIGDPSTNGRGLDVSITYDEAEFEEAIFCIGFVDEGGHELGAASSPPMRLDRAGGTITCRIQPLPLRGGIYFPFVVVLSVEGIVRDRWKLDRAVVVERDETVSAVGPVEFASAWEAASPG